MKYSPDHYAHILYTTKDTDAFFGLVKKHWVIPWLPTILARYEALVRKKEKVALVNVATVRPLSQEFKTSLERIISAHHPEGRLEFEYTLDANALGGFYAQSQEMIIEGSLLSKLNRLFGTL